MEKDSKKSSLKGMATLLAAGALAYGLYKMNFEPDDKMEIKTADITLIKVSVSPSDIYEDEFEISGADMSEWASEKIIDILGGIKFFRCPLSEPLSESKIIIDYKGFERDSSFSRYRMRIYESGIFRMEKEIQPDVYESELYYCSDGGIQAGMRVYASIMGILKTE